MSKQLTIPTRVTLALRSCEGQTLEPILPFLQLGAHVSIGRGLAVIDEVGQLAALGAEQEVVAYLCNSGARALLATEQQEAIGNAGHPLIELEDHRNHVAQLQAEALRLKSQLSERDALLEQMLINAERGLPPNLHRALQEMLPARPVEPANEAEREPFESWHRHRFATRHHTGAPTRDMHGGVYEPNYGPPNQQQMWEAWQARAALDQPTGGVKS